MKLSVSTHQGIMYSDEVDSFVISNQDGEFACLENHIPIISIIKEGYVKMTRNDFSVYVVLINGVMEFSNNVCNILAQEAQIGKSLEESKAILKEIITERTNLNKKQNIDYTELEKELSKELKKVKAGRL